MTILSLYQTVLITSLKYCDRVCVSVSYEDLFNAQLIIELWNYRDGVNVNFAQNAIRDCLFSGCGIICYGLHELIVDIENEFGLECNRGAVEAQEAVFTLAKEILSIFNAEGRPIQVNTNMCSSLIGIEVAKKYNLRLHKYKLQSIERQEDAKVYQTKCHELDEKQLGILH